MATIKSILTFQDKMSAILDKVSKSLEKTSQNSNKAEKSIKNLENTANNASGGFSSLQASIVTLSSAFQLFGQVKGIYDNINSKINEFISYTETEMRVQDQLAIITKQRMGLVDDEVRSLYDLASAQQKVGIIGDEVTVAGMAGLAAFTKQKTSIEALTPAMNNLAVKMYGYNATAESMDMISKSLGKAMLGDVGALSRMGIKIDDNTKKWLMTLKEEERAIELSKLIKNVTGDMNEEMAKTPFGKMTQANNRLSDSYEKLGAILLPLKVQMTEMWSEIITKIIDNFDTVVPLVLAALSVITVGFLTLKAEAIQSAIATATEWAIALWPLTLAIAIIAGVSAALNKMGISFSEQAENILISFNWIITGLKNIVIALENTWTFAENVVKNFSNIAMIALGNFFKWVFDKLKGVAKLIDLVFKTNLSNAISDFTNKIDTVNNAIANEIKKNSKQYKAFEKNDLYTNQDKASAQMKALKGGLMSGRDLLGKTGNGSSLALDGLTTSTAGGKALKTKQQGEIEINGEDLQLLHDMATRDYMINYSHQQLTPQVTFPNMIIHETADVDSVVEAFVNTVTDLAQSKMAVT